MIKKLVNWYFFTFNYKTDGKHFVFVTNDLISFPNSDSWSDLFIKFNTNSLKQFYSNRSWNNMRNKSRYRRERWQRQAQKQLFQHYICEKSILQFSWHYSTDIRGLLRLLSKLFSKWLNYIVDFNFHGFLLQQK